MALKDEIARMNEAWDKGVTNNDLDLVLAQYAPDAKMFPPGMPMLEGIDAIKRLLLKNSAAGRKAVEHETVSIDGSEDFAVVVGRYRMTIHPPGGSPFVQTGKSLYVVKRQPDGVLRVAYDTFSNDHA